MTKRFTAENFNLSVTLESGQLFRYHCSSDGFYHIVVGDSIIKIRQIGSRIEYICSSNSFDVKRFLGLNSSYSEILKSISRDEKITAAINKHYGLRILEQEPWECTASFICSAFSNIPRIKQCIEKVSAAFGSRIEFDGFQTFSFPQPQQINDFSKLKRCGLGYRAPYLFETARIFSNSNGIYSRQQIRKLSYADAKEKVMELPGVGSKVADCILLFSYGFFEAFPVDVWIHRAMTDMYGSELRKFAAATKTKAKNPSRQRSQIGGSRLRSPAEAGLATGPSRNSDLGISERAVADFARDYFGKYAGYAQQFLYHNARTQQKPIIYLTN
mgnify:CR=1 FL=1